MSDTPDSASGVPAFSAFFSADLSGFGRADERIRTANLLITSDKKGSLGVADGCESCIPRPVSFHCLTLCCTELRSWWYQSGVSSLWITRRQFLRTRCLLWSPKERQNPRSKSLFLLGHPLADRRDRRYGKRPVRLGLAPVGDRGDAFPPTGTCSRSAEFSRVFIKTRATSPLRNLRTNPRCRRVLLLRVFE